IRQRSLPARRSSTFTAALTPPAYARSSLTGSPSPNLLMSRILHASAKSRVQEDQPRVVIVQRVARDAARGRLPHEDTPKGCQGDVVFDREVGSCPCGGRRRCRGRRRRRTPYCCRTGRGGQPGAKAVPGEAGVVNSRSPGYWVE